MKQTAQALREAWCETPDELAEDFTATLVDFGYDVSQATVKGLIAGFYDGDPPRGGPAMFVYGWLTKGVD